MSFDFKNVKNVRATHLRNEKIENAVLQKRHSHKCFITLFFGFVTPLLRLLI